MEIKEKVLNNYNNEVASAVTKLSEKGFIHVTGTEEGIKTDYLVKYNCFSNDFETVDYGTFEDLLLNLVPNYWNIGKEELKNIFLNQCVKNLPTIEKNTIGNYFNYIEANENVKPSKDFKKELKALLKECKSKHNKVNTGNFFGSPEVHFQVLANKDVIYDTKVNKFYRYSKEEDKFIFLNATGLLNILRKDSNFYSPYVIYTADVLNYMSLEYKKYLINSSLPNRYNLNKQYEANLTNFKKDFEAIDKILKRFK